VRRRLVEAFDQFHDVRTQSNQEVARLLGISPHTVKFHVESLFKKLGASSRAAAVARGMRQQIVEL